MPLQHLPLFGSVSFVNTCWSVRFCVTTFQETVPLAPSTKDVCTATLEARLCWANERAEPVNSCDQWETSNTQSKPAAVRQHKYIHSPGFESFVNFSLFQLSRIRIFCELFFISDKWRKRGWSVRHFFLTEKENKFRSEILFTLLNFATDFHQTILYFDYYYHFFYFCKLKLNVFFISAILSSSSSVPPLRYMGWLMLPI